MIVGENAQPDDLEANPMRTKGLTNFRASGGRDDQVRPSPSKRATLEQAIAYIDDDEMAEVTPKSIRLRKRLLDANERKRASRATQSYGDCLRREIQGPGAKASGLFVGACRWTPLPGIVASAGGGCAVGRFVMTGSRATALSRTLKLCSLPL